MRALSRMKHGYRVFVPIVAMIVVGCSTANFGGQGGSPDGSGDKAALGNKGNTGSDKAEAQESGSADAQNDADATRAANKGGGANGEDVFNDDEFSASQTESKKEGEPKGCGLPDFVKSEVSTGSSLALTGWGGSGGGDTNLKNLNVKECDWFKTMKEKGEHRYMYVYTDEDEQQSYAGPGGKVNPIRFATCMSSAMQASRAVKNKGHNGSVSCHFAPKE